MEHRSGRDFRTALAERSRPARAALGRMVFVDVESCGLGPASWPVEIGWCGLDMKPVSLLVAPDPGWDRGAWEEEAEGVHGISLAQVERHGVPARDAAARVSEALEGRLAYSDAPAWDAAWISVLMAAAGLPVPFGLRDFADGLALCAAASDPPLSGMEELASAAAAAIRAYPHVHRAGADAASLAAQARAVSDAQWRKGLPDR